MRHINYFFFGAEKVGAESLWFYAPMLIMITVGTPFVISMVNDWIGWLF